MSAEIIIYYLLAFMIIGCGYLAVTSLNIFRSAIYLLFSLIGIAGLYFMMAFEFVAAVQIVVYVGGIVVLIIFSIFLTQQIGVELPMPRPAVSLAAALACIAGFIFTIIQLANYSFYTTGDEAVEPNMQNIGSQMLNVNETGMALPFEIISILLLAAMIGCIVIALKLKQTEVNSTD